MIHNPYHYNPIAFVGTRPGLRSAETTLGDLLSLLIFAEHTGVRHSVKLDRSTISALNSIEVMLRGYRWTVEPEVRDADEFITVISDEEDLDDIARKINTLLRWIVWDAFITVLNQIERGYEEMGNVATSLVFIWNTIQTDMWYERVRQVQQESYALRHPEDMDELQNLIADLSEQYATRALKDGGSMDVIGDDLEDVVWGAVSRAWDETLNKIQDQS